MLVIFAGESMTHIFQLTNFSAAGTGFYIFDTFTNKERLTLKHMHKKEGAQGNISQRQLGVNWVFCGLSCQTLINHLSSGILYVNYVTSLVSLLSLCQAGCQLAAIDLGLFPYKYIQ